RLIPVAWAKERTLAPFSASAREQSRDTTRMVVEAEVGSTALSDSDNVPAPVVLAISHLHSYQVTGWHQPPADGSGCLNPERRAGERRDRVPRGANRRKAFLSSA